MGTLTKLSMDINLRQDLQSILLWNALSLHLFDHKVLWLLLGLFLLLAPSRDWLGSTLLDLFTLLLHFVDFAIAALTKD